MEPNPARTRLYIVPGNAIATVFVLCVGLSACSQTTPPDVQPVISSDGQAGSAAAAIEADTPIALEPAESAPDPKNDLPVGAAGPLSINTHCGLRYARIDGTTWETEMVGDGSPPQAANLNEDVAGVVIRPTTNLVVFEFGPPDRTVEFVPATIDPSYICF